MDLADPATHGVKIKESEKIHKYLNLAIKLSKMRMAVIPLTVDALGNLPKALKKTRRIGSWRKSQDHLDY